MLRWLLLPAIALFALYALLAYFVLPEAWTRYEHRRRLAGVARVTATAEGIPGDPLNVGLVGTREDVALAMHAAGWSPADPVTFRTSLAIVGSVLFGRPYRDAPVSPLFLFGRRQDLAFEKEDGDSADRRRHVRLWQVPGEGGRPVWLGAATFDRSVGLSRYTGAVTHHIDPDIDATRAALIADLAAAGLVEATYSVSGVGPTQDGRNGEGDPYFTDGEIALARLVALGAS